MQIPFNKPYMNGKELFNISEAYHKRALSGDGDYTKKCQNALESYLNTKKVFLTHSGTAALELALLSLDLAPDDEVIVPSFTFVSCANAVLMAGGKPVFADCEYLVPAISLNSVARVVTEKTKAVMVVHYAGISVNLDEIKKFCERNGLLLIEDAAHCLGAKTAGIELGTIGDFGCFSFHETKNITCGEGGAIAVNNPKYIESIEIIREKGTDRTRFLNGQVDKYTWRKKGSSYLPSEITAAFLFAQLEDIRIISTNRMNAWNHYHDKFKILEDQGKLKRPHISSTDTTNGHIYYILLANPDMRKQLIEGLKRVGIQATFHYIPLHSSPFGLDFKHDPHGMDNTDHIAGAILRLPIWCGITNKEIDLVVNTVALILDNGSH